MLKIKFKWKSLERLVALELKFDIPTGSCMLALEDVFYPTIVYRSFRHLEDIFKTIRSHLDFLEKFNFSS